VENVRKQCNIQIHRMAEELSALQLECADKESQIERSLRERKAVEEELEKVYKDGRAEPEFRKIEALHQRCLNAERLKEDINLTLQSTQNKLKKMEMDYSEELSRCQEEVRRLQGLLAAARNDCVGVSEERLQLQQENMQLRKEMDELRKASMQIQRNAKQKVSQMEQACSLKEQGLDARVRELEERSRSSTADLTRLLAAAQKSTQRWKEEAKNLVQAFETKITALKAELKRQKRRSLELEIQLQTNHNTISEYEKQLAEYQEKTSRLQRRLTQAEQKATTALHQNACITPQIVAKLTVSFPPAVLCSCFCLCPKGCNYQKIMASASSLASSPDISEQTQDDEFEEPTRNLRQLQCSASPPGARHKIDPQAVLKRPVIRKQPSLQHLKAREQMIFPGWHTKSPSAQGKREPERPHGLPELQRSTILTRSLVKNPKVVAKPCLQHTAHWEPMAFAVWHPRLTSSPEKKKSNNFQDFIFLMYKDQPPSATSDHVTEDKYNPFCEPLCILPLAFQKIWRSFSFWRTKVFRNKLHLAKTSLQNRLFILEPCLREALMEIRKMSCQITDTELYYVKTNHTYTLKEFYDTQLKQQHEILSDLQPFRDLVRDVTVRAGHEYLLQHQTTPEDKDELNLVFFNRVNCFIRHVDNLIFNTVHCLVLNAVGVLLSVLQNQVGQMPSQITPQVRSDRSEAVPEENVEKKVGQFLSIYFSNASYYLLQIILDIVASYWFMFVSKVLPDLPLFMSELVLESDVLMYNPSEENFQETIREIIRQFKTTAISVRSLTADPEMDLLLKSEKFKDSVQSGPSLDTVLKEDGHLRVIIQNISDSIHTAFDSAKVYSHTFDHFLAFSKNNENLDLDAVWQLETDLTFFAKTLELYHCKRKEALAIQERRYLGLLLVDQTQLKQKLVSSTLCSLEGFHEMLTQQTRKKVDVLLAKVVEAKSKLENYPSTTEEMAEQLIFLDEIEDGILELQEQHESVSKVYNLFNTYSVTIPPEDLVDFAKLQPTIYLLYDLIDDAVAERDTSMERFISSLVTDQNKLQEEVTKMACVLQNPDFLDTNANSSRVRSIFEKIQISVDELQALALACSSCERKFKLENTRFDLLEESTAKFKLILLLWDSVEEWDCLENEWQQSLLKQLDLKQFSMQISNYNQYVEQLERGLPPNCSVVLLKDKVERMKQKLPIITNLCNLCMKPKLWASLESLVGTSLDVEEVTLGTLEEHDVFSYGMEILQILN
ncbi:hypothetical protein ATANTOWER_019463, partial [Ataeniobius toweri]|nr:hypothetical protein [Ataeniobius toweri]